MLLSIIRNRRSIRKYLSKPVENDKLEVIKEAVLRAPSSRGFNPWEFILVTNPDLIIELSKAKKHGSSFLKNAPLAVVILADSEKSDVWVEDAAIAATYLQLTAEELGLKSCWVQIRKRPHSDDLSAADYIKQKLNILEKMEVASIIGIGYPDEEKSPHTSDDLQWQKIHQNRFNE